MVKKGDIASKYFLEHWCWWWENVPNEGTLPHKKTIAWSLIWVSMCCRFWPENYQHDDFKACLRNYLTQCITIFNKRERRYPRCHDIDIHSKSWRGKEHKAGLPRGDPPPTGNSAGAASAVRRWSGWPSSTTTYLLQCAPCTIHCPAMTAAEQLQRYGGGDSVHGRSWVLC